MKVLITGATGFIGHYIIKALKADNISIHFLTTRYSATTSITGAKGFYWNPNKNEIDTACLKGVTAIIHLAGASIAKRWTDSYKKTILNSRINTAQLLYNTLSNNPHTVTHFISASAIGVYPSSLDKIYTETNTVIANNFLGKVVNQWEVAANKFIELGIDVAKIRIGLVLESKNGMLKQLLMVAKWGAASAFGSGKQWQSWIHILDLAAIFRHVLINHLTGIFNAVGPEPVSQKDVIKTLTQTINKPLIFPNVPRFIMELILGEMHLLLFDSQRVSSEKIEKAGYKFKFKTINSALSNLLQ